jgi:hypothetical protein
VTVRAVVTHRALTARALLTAWLARPSSALALLGVAGIGTALVGAALVLKRGGVALTARPLLALWLPLGVGIAALVSAVAVRLVRPGALGGGIAVRYLEVLRGIVAAFVVLLPLSVVPLALFLWRATDSSDIVLFPPLLDRRYLLVAYYLLVLGVPISLLAGARIADSTRADPVPARRDVSARGTFQASAGRRPRPLLLVTTGVATATYFYGPPWGTRPLGGPIDYHETVHFAGLQSIRLGELPYVGSASDQYGPGSQLFNYCWMRLIGGFDLAGFRQAYAAQHWLAVAFVCALVLLFLPMRAALVSLALAILVFPTFQFFGFDGGGYNPNSFFGWANVGRYSGLLLLGLALPHLLFTAPGNRRLFGTLGAAWGVTCLLAQESFLGGLVVIAAVLTSLLLSASVQGRDLRSAVLALVAGWSIVVGPLLLVYLGYGEIGPFLRNYFLYPLAVSSGYSNTTWWQGGPWHATYLLLPVFTLACGLIAVGRLTPPAIAPRWSPERGVLFGCFAAAAVAQAGALLRADTSHLFNVMLITPILLGATAAMGGQLLGFQSVTSRLFVAACVVAAGWGLLPWSSSSLALARQRLTQPVSGRTAQFDQLDNTEELPGIAGRRLGSSYRVLPRCCTSTNVPVEEFVRFANRLRRLVGTRRTYISTSVPDHQPGLWYFMADLRPFDLPIEPTAMAFDRASVRENLRALADRRRPLDAVVTTDPTSADSRIAIERLGARPAVRRLHYAGSTVQVFLAS